MFFNDFGGTIVKLDPILSNLPTGKPGLEVKSDLPAAPGKASQKQGLDDANGKSIKLGAYIEKVNVDTATITASCFLIGEVDNVTKPVRLENLPVSQKAKITDRGKEVKLTDLQLLPRIPPSICF